MKRLKGWKINLLPYGVEGYCWKKEKVIDLGLKNSNPLRLLLHEIAHIGTGNSCGNQHTQDWFDEYIKLMKKYMPNIDIDEGDKIIQKVYNLTRK